MQFEPALLPFMNKVAPLFLLFLLSISGYSQDLNYQGLILPKVLTEKANAIIRSEKVEVEIKAVDKMTILTERVVTVLNEYGQGVTRTGDVYDEVTTIRKQEAVFYDKFGKEIKKVRKRDFLDQSLPGANLITDNRVSYYEFTPKDYPYTVVYTSEVETESTVFVNTWDPVSGYYTSVESSSYSLKNPAGIPLRFEERNLDSLQVEIMNSDYELSYSLKNLPAFKRETLSPDLDTFLPQVKVALDEFSLVGVKGAAKDWSEFGKWQYEHLLSETTALSSETVQKISMLTASAETDLEKAELIYDYVQKNTRYISVQLGIGGWEPMTAAEVDKLGYGDCKALTNYTRALLESQDITSYYAVVYGDEEQRDIDPDFASMQGNHVILNIPHEGEDVWLECTSQTIPFNYLGDFTDNRNVLLITPEGGEIVKTRNYDTAENLQESFTSITLDGSGGFSAEFVRTTKGVPYGNLYHLMREPEKEQHLYYKESWSHLRNLDLQKINFINNRKEPEFVEELSFIGERFASQAGNRILLPLHLFSPSTYDLPNNPNRRFPLEITRGRTYRETFEFILPEGFEVESLPEDVKIENQYGLFSIDITQLTTEGQNKIKVQRHYVINSGKWNPDSYSEYREFMNKINALSNQKAVLIESI